jgi:hypothetical protein
MSLYCSQCNQANPTDAAFCLNCASPLKRAAAVNAGESGADDSHGSGDSSQKGLFAMILAIVALVCCGPFTGIPAAILGWLELDSIKNGRSPADNKWMAMVGLWGGIASTLIHIVIYVLWALMGMLSAASDPYYY